MKRACLGCGVLQEASRCPKCRKEQREQFRGKYAGDWTRTSALIRQEWIAAHGFWCPGDQHHKSHDCADLTVDHGADGVLRVLCRAGNTAKRNRGDG